MKKYILIKYYLIIWVMYFLIIAVLPAAYIKDDYYLSILYLLVFIGVSSATFFIFSLSYPHARNRQIIYGIEPPKYLNSIIIYAVMFSISGVAFVFYDRVAIQGVDYTKGIAFAREQWRVLGESRSGFSSGFSLIGNLFSGFPIVLSSIVYLYYDELNKKLRLTSILVAFSTVGASSLLSGGRSIVMMFLLSLFLIALLRKSRGVGVMPKAISVTLRVFFTLVVAVALIYGVYVFHLRAIAGGDSSGSYMISMLNHLGGRPHPITNSNELSVIADILNYFTIAGAYLVHSAWTLQSILDLNNYEGMVTFSFYRANLARILNMDGNVGWEFSGLFSTYVGAFYYDYGVLGAIVSSCVIGFLIFISSSILYAKQLSLINVGVYLASMYIVMLSPLLFAMDIMSYPFILFDLFLLYVISIFYRVRFTLH